MKMVTVTALFMCLIFFVLLGRSSGSDRSGRGERGGGVKQHNLFDMEGVQSPVVLSRTNLSHEKSHLSLLSAAVSSDFGSDDWFSHSLTTAPEFMKSQFHRNKMFNSHHRCQLRLLGLGHYGSLFNKENRSNNYEGGLATVSVQLEGSGRHILLSCYYVSGRDQFLILKDDPSTIPVAILCPFPMTKEVGGDCLWKKQKNPSEDFLRTVITLRIFPSRITSPSTPHPQQGASTVHTNRNHLGRLTSTASRGVPHLLGVGKMLLAVESEEPSRQALPHAVCTCQTFKNDVSGIFLYLFASYYLEMGYVVIIYDRFGNHFDFIKSFIEKGDSGGSFFRYHPYTSLQLSFPDMFSPKSASEQSAEYRLYKPHFIQDTAVEKALSASELNNQDAEKRRTYDLARLDYATKVHGVLFVDSDEFLFCPGFHQTSSRSQQRLAQREVISSALRSGHDEIQFSRVSQFARKPLTWQSSQYTNYNATMVSMECMREAYHGGDKSIKSLFACWSGSSLKDKEHNPKSMDLSSPCPFHYNHYACAFRTGRSEHYRCNCKFSRPSPEVCHIVHINNKFIGNVVVAEDLAKLRNPFLEMSNLWMNA